MENINQGINTPSGPKRNNVSALVIFLFILMIFITSGVYLAVKIFEGKDGRDGGGSDKVVADGKIKKFENYGEMENFLDENINNMVSAYSYLGFSTAMLNEARIKTIDSGSGPIQTWGNEEAPGSSNSDTGTGIGGGGDYSTTNVQVSGVDEGDIVKTDGKYIYVISGQELIIALAYPAENAEVLSRIKFSSSPRGIYVSGDSLAIFGQDYDILKKESSGNIIEKRRNSGFTFLKIFNISDRKNPKEEKSLDFEGYYANSRMIGNYIYFVTSHNNFYPYYYEENFPLPLVIENGEVLNNDKGNAKCLCQDVYYFDIPYKSYSFTTVSAVNISDVSEKMESEVFLLDGSQNNMFVSENNIYVTFNKYVSEEELVFGAAMEIFKEKLYPKISAKDRERIEEIEKAKNYVLTPEEKFQKITMIMQKYEDMFSSEEKSSFQKELIERVKRKYEDISKEMEKTAIHKIGINGKELEYKFSGEVPGMVLNQFSMDESNGYFRIATTKNRIWSQFVGEEQRDSYSNIYVLDGEMKTVGKVENIAKGEQIYSVRFMQSRAYMVTFRRMDPLFVIDLSDQQNPIILGELKVPGFSSYLHPYNENTLIGLGKETDEEGRVIGGVKLSLFDVADVENPKELDKYVIGDSSSDSIAINEHKAFLFSKEKNLLVIPVTARNIMPMLNEGISFEEQEMMMPPVYQENFNGAYVFSIDKFKFNLRGKSNHADKSENGYWGSYNIGVKRSLYIKDMLYTLSNKYLKANRLEDLADVKKIEISANDSYPVPLMK